MMVLRDGGLGLVRAADAAGVFPEGDITDIIMHFYGPVAAQVREQVTGAGLARGQAGDAEDGDGAKEAAVRAVAVALDHEHLPDVREQFGDAPGGRHGLDGADVDAAVAAVCGSVLDGERFPAQRVGRVEQARLVLPDREHELRAPAHDLPGVLTHPDLREYAHRRWVWGPDAASTQPGGETSRNGAASSARSSRRHRRSVQAIQLAEGPVKSALSNEFVEHPAHRCGIAVHDGDGRLEVSVHVEVLPVEHVPGIAGELLEEGALCPAVALAERVDRVDLAKVVGQPIEELLACQVPEEVLFAELAEDLGCGGLDVPGAAEQASLGDGDRADLPGPFVDVAEDPAVNLPQVKQVVAKPDRCFP
jgi:hypothetical protein